MKTLKTVSILKQIFGVILLAGVLGTLSSCVTNSKFLSSSTVPAAHGGVKVKTDHNNNYNIDVDVANLAQVEKLQTSKNSYVVWMETDQGRTINLGQLDSGTGFLSKQLKASLSTKSSFKPVRIFITTEVSPNAQYPDHDVILTTERF
jgi:hypothetical protein